MLAVLHSPVFEPPPCASERTGFGFSKRVSNLCIKSSIRGLLVVSADEFTLFRAEAKFKGSKQRFDLSRSLLGTLRISAPTIGGVELLGVEEHVDVDKEDVDAETFNLRPQLS